MVETSGTLLVVVFNITTVKIYYKSLLYDTKAEKPRRMIYNDTLANIL